jgi:hypothetical protein
MCDSRASAAAVLVCVTAAAAGLAADGTSTTRPAVGRHVHSPAGGSPTAERGGREHVGVVRVRWRWLPATVGSHVSTLCSMEVAGTTPESHARRTCSPDVATPAIRVRLMLLWMCGCWRFGRCSTN